jgi:hypothetical protein
MRSSQSLFIGLFSGDISIAMGASTVKDSRPSTIARASRTGDFLQECHHPPASPHTALAVSSLWHLKTEARLFQGKNRCQLPVDPLQTKIYPQSHVAQPPLRRISSIAMSSDLRHLEKIYRGPCGSRDPNLDVGVSQNEIASLNRSPQRAWHRDLSSDMPFDSQLLHFFGSYALAGAGI